MMLETIRTCIDNISDASFESYFMQYLFYVQDNNIEDEVRYVTHQNSLSIITMDKLIQQTYKGLVDIC